MGLLVPPNDREDPDCASRMDDDADVLNRQEEDKAERTEQKNNRRSMADQMQRLTL